MKEDKGTLVRNYILDKLEQGILWSKAKVPGARDMAKEIGISLLTVQKALETLVNEGILETVARRGTFVHKDWKNRVLQRNVVVFHSDILWLDGFKKLICQEIPALWVSQQFKRGIFEIQTTHYVQSHHDEYMDIPELFELCYPDKSDFAMKPFEAFRVGKRLVGVPIIYSPRVLIYNPKLFSEVGCPVPESGWGWDDFIFCIRKLRQRLLPEETFYWNDDISLRFNFVLCCGGKLMNSDSEDIVMIDNEKTRRGLTLFRELRHELGLEKIVPYGNYVNQFMDGRVAMSIEPREFLSNFARKGFQDWNIVPLPHIPGGVDLNLQATESFCVRRECVNIGMAAQLLKLLLSSVFQNQLADLKYGLPVRQSALGRSVDYHDSRDMLFLNEVSKMRSDYNLDSVDLHQLVCQGISHLLNSDDDINVGTAELANVLRIYLKIKNKTQ